MRWTDNKVVPFRRRRRYRRPYTPLAAFLMSLAFFAAGIVSLALIQRNLWILFAAGTGIAIGRSCEIFTRSRGGWR